MDLRKWQSGASGTPPSAPVTPSVGFPKDSVPGVSPATNPGAHWFYQLSEEMRAVLVAAGITPDNTSTTQLLAALNAMFAHVVLDSGTPCGLKAGAVKLLFKRGAFSDVPTGTPGASVAITWPDGGFATACLFALVSFEATAGDPTNWQAAIVAKSTTGCKVQEWANVVNPGTFVVMGFGW